MPEHEENPAVNDTDNLWKDTMTGYDYFAPLPDPADARFWIQSLSVWLATDGAAEDLAEVSAIAARAARYEARYSDLADLASGYLSAGASLDVLAALHDCSLALTAISQNAAEYLTGSDPVTRAVLAWITAPDALDVLGEISAVCVHAALLAGASETEIIDWVTAWQSSGIGRRVLTAISALAAVLATLAGHAPGEGAES